MLDGFDWFNHPTFWDKHFWMVLVHLKLRWLPPVLHFPEPLNFTKGFLAHYDGLVPVLARWVLQQLLTSQFLYFQHKFCYHGNYTEAQIHPIFTVRLHFTQKLVGELPFLLHQNCLHIKEHFLRKFKKILSRGFYATLMLQNIKVAPKPLDRIF